MFENDPQPPQIVPVSQPLSKAVYDYWNGLRDGRPLPSRRDIDPARLRSHLPHLMLLERAGGHDIFRLAGTAICAAFGRELRDHSLQSLWEIRQSKFLDGILSHGLERRRALAIRFRAHALGRRPLPGELMLLPVLDDSGAARRWLGSFAFTRGSQESKVFTQLELLTAQTLLPSKDQVKLEAARALPHPSLALVRPHYAPGFPRHAPTMMRPWDKLFERFSFED